MWGALRQDAESVSRTCMTGNFGASRSMRRYGGGRRLPRCTKLERLRMMSMLFLRGVASGVSKIGLTSENAG